MRRLAKRGAALDEFLPVILRQSVAELLNAGVVSPTSDAQVYARWSEALTQTLDRVAGAAASDDVTQETPVLDNPAATRRRAIR